MRAGSENITADDEFRRLGEDDWRHLSEASHIYRISERVVGVPFPREKYEQRLSKVRRNAEEEGFDAVITCVEEDIYYLTGIAFRMFECPFILVVLVKDTSLILLPLLEEDYFLSQMAMKFGHEMYDE